MAARAVEIEWQFVVRDVDAFERWLAALRFAHWSLEAASVVRLSDTYLDTADWRVWGEGFALRVRRNDARTEASLKALGRARRGAARRREIAARVRDARPATLRALGGPVGAAVRRATASGRLRRLFAVRTRRHTFTLRHDGRAVAEIALDRTGITAGRGRSRRLERLEVEVKAGPPDLVARFVATLRRRRPLTLATRSKFAEGLRTARLLPPPR
ncbi:MAG: CYTH domain-containing protein [Candidatus Binatia bacterium]